MNNMQLEYRSKLLDSIDNSVIQLKAVKKCVCGGENYKTVASTDRFGLPFEAKCCDQCGLIYTDPIIDFESLPLYYDKYYHPLHFGYEKANEHTYLTYDNQGERIFSFIRCLIPNMHKETVNIAEVGSASGYNLSAIRDLLAEEGIRANVFGCDYSKELVDIANEKNRVTTYYGGIETLLKASTKYDIIILSHIFEHFVDLEKTVELLDDSLGGIGLLYIEVPGVLDLRKKYEYECNFEKYFTHAHTYHFSLITLRNVLCKRFTLAYGNEFVQAVFCKGPLAPEFRGAHNRIISYLDDLREKQDLYLTRNPNLRATAEKKSILKRLIIKVVKMLST